MIPLLRAAGMSPWLFLALFLPVVNLIIWIVWCFRICRVRQKSALLGILLLLPVTNILAFVYLALSGYGPEAENDSERWKNQTQLPALFLTGGQPISSDIPVDGANRIVMFPRVNFRSFRWYRGRRDGFYFTDPATCD